MSKYDELCRRIERDLQVLAQNKGVQREDLLRLLAGKLGILAQGWELDLRRDIDDVREDIRKQIMGHLSTIDNEVQDGNTPLPERRPQDTDRLSQEDRMEQFRRVIRVLFNVHERGKAGNFPEKLLMQRYEWLNGTTNRSQDVNYRIIHDAARDDLEFFRREVAKILAPRVLPAATTRHSLRPDGETVDHPDTSHGSSDYADPGSATSTGEDVEASTAPQEERSPTTPTRVGSKISTNWFSRRQRIAALVAFAASIGIAIYALWPSAHNGSTSATGKSASSVSSVGANNSAPIAYTISYGDPNDQGCGGGLRYVYPFPASKMPTFPSGVTDIQYAQKYHAIPTTGFMIGLTVQGTGTGAVVLTGLEVKVKSRRAAIVGSYEEGGCGGIPGRAFDLLLDQTSPQASPEAEVTNFPYQVSNTDSEFFQVWPEGVNSYVTYSLLLDWSYQGRSGQLVIDDHGTPFQFTGFGASAGGYFDSSGKWKSQG
jgi:hypothetical protein